MRAFRWLLPLLILALAAGCSPAPAATQTPAPAVSQMEALPPLVSPQEAQTMMSGGDVVLLDVRTQEEWVTDGHAAAATLIPLDQLESRLSELNPDQTILVICRSGNRSQTAAALLRERGFTNVSEVEGGMRNWASQGLEVVYE